MDERIAAHHNKLSSSTTTKAQLPPNARVVSLDNVSYTMRANSPMSIVNSDKFQQHYSSLSASVIRERETSVALAWNTYDQDGSHEGVFGKLLVQGAVNISDEYQVN